MFNLVPAFLAPLLWGLASILYKHGSRQTSLGSYLIITNISGLMFAFSFFSNFQLSFFPISMLILLSFLLIVGSISYYMALRMEDAHVVLPLTSTSSLISVFLSIFFFHEQLSFLQLIGIICVVVGAVLVSLDDIKNMKITRSILFVFLAIIAWVCSPIITKSISPTYSPYQITAFTSFMFVIVGLVLERKWREIGVGEMVAFLLVVLEI